MSNLRTGTIGNVEVEVYGVKYKQIYEDSQSGRKYVKADSANQVRFEMVEGIPKLNEKDLSEIRACSLLSSLNLIRPLPKQREDLVGFVQREIRMQAPVLRSTPPTLRRGFILNTNPDGGAQLNLWEYATY